jgi:hypothetical protein
MRQNIFLLFLFLFGANIFNFHLYSCFGPDSFCFRRFPSFYISLTPQVDSLQAAVAASARALESERARNRATVGMWRKELDKYRRFDRISRFCFSSFPYWFLFFFASLLLCFSFSSLFLRFVLWISIA